MFKNLSGVLISAIFLTPIMADSTKRVVTEFPSGTFLENLVVTDNGDTVITSYFDQELLTLTADNQLQTLAKLDVHPVSVLKLDKGYLITAHGLSFTDGPEFTQTQKILHLDDNGLMENDVDVPNALFLNGMTQISDDTVLIADSITGTIWQYNIET